mmetsp:Transcript_28737/g.54452  ORF Transcript_28737/g.54452 Transcript_28737/m.54452 type:complete len:215 (+) Transcript_28737:493-1137(+)
MHKSRHRGPRACPHPDGPQPRPITTKVAYQNRLPTPAHWPESGTPATPSARPSNNPSQAHPLPHMCQTDPPGGGRSRYGPPSNPGPARLPTRHGTRWPSLACQAHLATDPASRWERRSALSPAPSPTLSGPPTDWHEGLRLFRPSAVRARHTNADPAPCPSTTGFARAWPFRTLATAAHGREQSSASYGPKIGVAPRPLQSRAGPSPGSTTARG